MFFANDIISSDYVKGAVVVSRNCSQYGTMIKFIDVLDYCFSLSNMYPVVTVGDYTYSNLL